MAGSVLAALFGLSLVGVLPLVLIAAVGVVDVIGEVISNTILQTGTPEELLERSEGLRTSMTSMGDARYVETQNRLLLRR